MKKTAMIILALGLCVGAYAFMEMPRDNMHERFASLDLSKEQKAQLKTIRKEARSERIKLMDQMDDLREKTEERVMAVLTDKQREQLRAKQSEMRPKPGTNGCNRDKMVQDKPPFE